MLVLGTIWRPLGSPDRPSDPPAVVDVANTAPSPSTASAVPAPSTAPSPAASVSAALQREFFAAPDLYAFTMQARRRPAEGGLFYAMQAASYCSYIRPDAQAMQDERIAAQIEERSTVSPRQLAMLDRYRRRCAGFAASDLYATYRSLADEGSGRRDPLVNAAAELRSASQTDDREAGVRALKRVIELRDPLLLSTNWAYLSNPDGIGKGTDGPLWFDGDDYRATRDEFVFQTALEIAACVPGAPCRRDFTVMLACTVRGFCVDDPADLDLKRMGAGPESAALAGRIRALADRMRAAIDRSDVDAFRAPPELR